MEWFGHNFGAPVYEAGKEISVPVGEKCVDCGKLFVADDSGFAMPFIMESTTGIAYYHRDCLLWNIGIACN
jgi:hypothetical protein